MMTTPSTAALARPENTVPFSLILFVAGVLLLTSAIAATDFFAKPELFGELLKLLLISGCAWRLAACGWRRTGLFFGALTLFAGLSAIAALLSMILAATALPYVDATLAQMDATLFGDALAIDIVRIGRTHPVLLSCLSHIYDWLNIQPLLLISWFSCRNRVTDLIRFLNAWAIALAMTLAMFPFFPAVGFYLHHAIAAPTMPGLTVHAAWNHVDTLAALRSGTLRGIDGQSFYGIVTFPSFHAAGAVLLSWGFWRHRLLRWPMAVVNAAMVVSAVFVGGHYLVDLIGGTLLAVVAIRLATTIANPALAFHPAHALFSPSPDRLWLR